MTRDERAALFAREVHYWLRALGVLAWEVIVAVERIPAKWRAHCDYGEVNRLARIVLNERHVMDLTAHEIARSAFHEVAHLMLQPLADIDRAASAEAEHAVIRTLENALWEPDWRRRESPVVAVAAIEPVPAILEAL